MKTIHFSLTPLAGSPIRIINALNKHTDIVARLVVLNPHAYGTRVFDNDLTWDSDKEVALELLDKSDIIHLHHYFDLVHNPFGINFEPFLAKGIKIIRQFQSHPLLLSGGNLSLARQIVQSEIPQLVIPHYPERYFPKARVVPNLVPINDTVYQPLPKQDHPVSIFYAPSSSSSAWQFPTSLRWNSKGFPETAAFLRSITKQIPSIIIVIRQDIPHRQCLAERQLSHISIDEMVAGSFHLSSLEGLSQGIPTFAHLDSRTIWNIAELTGTIEHPWMNFRLEDAERPLLALIEDNDLRKEIGVSSRLWMVKYWNDREIIQHYVRAYNDLLERPEIYRIPRFDITNKRTMWIIQGADDAVWEMRHQRSMNRRCKFPLKHLRELIENFHRAYLTIKLFLKRKR